MYSVCEFAPDPFRKRVAVAYSDGSLHVCLLDIEYKSRNQNLLQQSILTRSGEPHVTCMEWYYHRSLKIHFIAACSDQFFLYRENTGSGSTTWSIDMSFPLSNGPATCVSWAPQGFGTLLAISFTSGEITVVRYDKNNRWLQSSFMAHEDGCTSLSWSPDMPPNRLHSLPLKPSTSDGLLSSGIDASLVVPACFVSCGNESCARIWKGNASNAQWLIDHELRDEQNLGWAPWLDVAWAPNVGLPCSYIALAGVSGVRIWMQYANDSRWTQRSINCPELADKTVLSEGREVPGAALRVAWSNVGTILSVTLQDQRIVCLKEDPESGEWETVASWRASETEP